MVFGQKLQNAQHGVDRCARKSPVTKGANGLKESSRKKSLKLNAASHNNASWSTDADGFLEHSPSGRSLSFKDRLIDPPEDNSALFLGPPSSMPRKNILYSGFGTFHGFRNSPGALERVPVDEGHWWQS